MIYLPLIYFVSLTVFLAVKKKDFDVSVFMSGLFALTSLMSVVVVRNNLLGDAGILFTNDNLKLGLVPTLFYCILPTITILPFFRLKMNEIEKISVFSDKVFVIFSVGLLLVAMLNFYLPIDKYIDVLRNGTWMNRDCGESPSYTGLWAAKTNHYNGMKHGYQIRLEQLPLFFGYFFYFSKCTLLLIPCFFYSLCIANKKWWFSLMLLVGSFSTLAISIQTADRTEFVNYALMFVVNVLIFKTYFAKKHLIVLAIMIAPVIAVGSFYFIGVTKARFHTDEHGEMKGIVQYSGQSYLNFCYFYENAKHETLYFERTFPMTNHFLLDKNYDEEASEKRLDANGFKPDVFPSFLGTFLLDLGKIPMILWTLAFFALCIIFLPRPGEKEVSFWKIMLLYTLAVVPTFGIFYYRYFHFTFALIPVIAFVMLAFSTIYIKITEKK